MTREQSLDFLINWGVNFSPSSSRTGQCLYWSRCLFGRLNVNSLHTNRIRYSWTTGNMKRVMQNRWN